MKVNNTTVDVKVYEYGEIVDEYKAIAAFDYVMDDKGNKLTIVVDKERIPVYESKRVRCVNNNDYRGCMTVGKLYSTVSETVDMYYVKDDEGDVHGMYKWRFEEVGVAQGSVGKEAIEKGDTVICVDRGNEYLTLGKGYEVTEIVDGLGRIRVVNDRGNSPSYPHHHFKLHKKKESPNTEYIKVECIDNKGCNLTLGKIYTVEPLNGLRYSLIDDKGYLINTFRTRFIGVNPKAHKVNKVNEPSRSYIFATEHGLKRITLKNVTEVIVSESGNHRVKANGKLEIIPAGWLRVSIEGSEWAW